MKLIRKSQLHVRNRNVAVHTFKNEYFAKQTSAMEGFFWFLVEFISATEDVFWESIFRITAQRIKFSIKDFFSKCDQIRSFLWIWSHLLRKSLMENFIFGALDFEPVHLTFWELEGWYINLKMCHCQRFAKKTSAIEGFFLCFVEFYNLRHFLGINFSDIELVHVMFWELEG